MKRKRVLSGPLSGPVREELEPKGPGGPCVLRGDHRGKVPRAPMADEMFSVDKGEHTAPHQRRAT